MLLNGAGLKFFTCKHLRLKQSMILSFTALWEWLHWLDDNFIYLKGKLMLKVPQFVIIV
jgi:hypothetical protein